MLVEIVSQLAMPFRVKKGGLVAQRHDGIRDLLKTATQPGLEEGGSRATPSTTE